MDIPNITPHGYSVSPCFGMSWNSGGISNFYEVGVLVDVDGRGWKSNPMTALKFTLPETNVAPENRGPLEKEIHIGNHYV